MSFQDTKTKLDSVSSCFCLAKWTTVTLHLESVTTHSCHHPKVHEIPLSEVQKNPAAIHNTEFKIKQRKQMINGQRPLECDYCWNIEDLKGDHISDRIIKSSAPYSMIEFKKILKDPLSNIINPKYVEVSFSQSCQFKCSYCSANYSSTWEEELNQFGNYSTFSGIKNNKTFVEEENPYIRAFWQWWPELKQNLNTFRITGGEPLLSPSTFRVMENLIENPEPNLNLVINSNMGAPKVLIDKYISLSQKLIRTQSVASIETYTSLDAFGSRAEYIRHGLKHDDFWDNVGRFLEANEKLTVIIMCTFNALSVTSFVDFLKKIMEFNLKYRTDSRTLPVCLDIAYLRHPEYQNVLTLDEEYLEEMNKISHFIFENQWYKTENNVGFHEDHIIKFNRILDWMKKPISLGNKKIQQKRFYQFFSEHDARRKTDFLNTFPEMSKFWLNCKKAYEDT